MIEARRFWNQWRLSIGFVAVLAVFFGVQQTALNQQLDALHDQTTCVVDVLFTEPGEARERDFTAERLQDVCGFTADEANRILS